MQNREDISKAVLAPWVAVLKKESHFQPIQDSKESQDNYSKYMAELYASLLSDLLKSGISFANCKIEAVLDFLNDAKEELFLPKQCNMIWQFVVGFGLRKGATLDQIAEKLQVIYKKYPILVAQELEQEDLHDKELKLPLRIKMHVIAEADRLVKQYIYMPDDQGRPSLTLTDEEILFILAKNNELLKFAPITADYPLKNLGYELLDAIAQFNEKDQVYYDEEKKCFHPSLMGETLYARAIKKRDKKLCHAILDRMVEAGFSEQTIANILTFPDNKPLLDVCSVDDDVALFERVRSYTAKTVEDLEFRKLLVQSAIHHNRVAILRHLKDVLQFDMQALCQDLPPVFTKMQTETENFLLHEAHVGNLPKGFVRERSNAKTGQHYQGSFKEDSIFIKTELSKLKPRENFHAPIAPDDKQKQDGEVFDKIYNRYALAKANGAKPEELLSLGDAKLLLEKGQLLPHIPEKKIKGLINFFSNANKKNAASPVILRSEACANLQNDIQARELLLKTARPLGCC